MPTTDRQFPTGLDTEAVRAAVALDIRMAQDQADPDELRCMLAVMAGRVFGVTQALDGCRQGSVAAVDVAYGRGLAAGRTAAADPLDTLDADELLTATNGLRAYIRLCGSRMSDDHPLRRVAAKLAARVAENGADRG